MKDIPVNLARYAQDVHFTGNEKPSMPINWRFAESLAALKAFEALMLSHLRVCKYGVKAREININT